MCYMNLSDHSISIHKSIQQLQEGITKLKVEGELWLDSLFDWLSLAPLWRELLKICIYILIGILVIMVFVPCLHFSVFDRFDKTVKVVFIVQKKRGRCWNAGG